MVDPELRTNSRAALVEAAFEEFSTKGYEAATVAGIAERAGVTTGALYAHFTGKLDLLLATVDLTPIADVARSFDELDPTDAAGLVELLAHGVAERPDPRRVLLLDVIVAARRDPQVAEVLRGGLEGYVRATAGALGASEGASRVLAVLNLGMVVFAALDARTPPAVEFARLFSSLLPAEADGAGSGALDRVRRRAAELVRAEAALRDAIVEAADHGFSLRRVGAAAGRSHEAVRTVVAASSSAPRERTRRAPARSGSADS